MFCIWGIIIPLQLPKPEILWPPFTSSSSSCIAPPHTHTHTHTHLFKATYWLYLSNSFGNYLLCSIPKLLVVVVKPLSHAPLFATLWTIACQAPLSMGLFQAIILQWVAISFCRGSSWPRDWICMLCISRWVLYRATWGAPDCSLAYTWASTHAAPSR